MDGDLVFDVDVPGDDDFDGGVDSDAFSDFGAEESEQGVAEAGHGGGGDSPEEDLAECPD